VSEAKCSPLGNLTQAVGIANNGATFWIVTDDSSEVFTGANRLGAGNQPMTLRKNGAGATPVRVGTP